MAMTVANGILWMRQLVRDTDTTLQGLSDTEYLRFINGRYLTIFKAEKRAKETALFTDLAASSYNTASAINSAEEILNVTRNVDANRRVVLERMEWNELRNLQDYDSTAGTPLRYAAHKRVADGEWQIAFHPIPDVATYDFNVLHTVSPTELSTASTPVLGDAEAYWMYRLAAADVALVLGRPDLIDAILQPIPEAFMVKIGMEQKRLDPKRRDETAVV